MRERQLLCYYIGHNFSSVGPISKQQKNFHPLILESKAIGHLSIHLNGLCLELRNGMFIFS